jgi:hypothetical protein
MPKPIKIAILSPCKQNWGNMTPTQQGRFCASCQKSVIDFTGMTDRQVAGILKKDKTVCGRFLESQLERELILPREKTPAWAVAGAAAVALMALGTTPAQAQEPQKTEQGETTPKISETTAAPHLKTITGTVRNQNGQLLKDAGVTNKKTGKKTVTDANGAFSIEAAPGDVLHFEHNGLIPLNVPVTNTTKTVYAKLSLHHIVMGSPRYF